VVAGDAAAGLGWRDESRLDDEKWPIRYTGATDGIPWRLSVDPAIDNPDGEKVPDRFWWTTDAIQSDAFFLIAGYSRYGSLDWVGQVGVQNYREIEQAADALVAALEASRWPTTLDAPWLAIGDFVDRASTLQLDDRDLWDVEIKAAEPDRVRQWFDRRVIAALHALKALVTGSESSFRIWLGAPNLRIQVHTVVADEERRPEIMKAVVELGAAVARRHRDVESGA